MVDGKWNLVLRGKQNIVLMYGRQIFVMERRMNVMRNFVLNK